jgi:hypothetical protein
VDHRCRIFVRQELYFAGKVGDDRQLLALPQASDANALTSKALAAKADGVVVWGSPSDAAYVHIVEKVKLAQRLLSATPFTAPYKGEVGTVLLFRRAN